MINAAELALELYDAAEQSRPWGGVLANIARGADADEAGVFTAQPGEPSLSSFRNGCFPRSVHEQYINDFAGLDTQMLRALAGPGNVAVSGNDLISHDELRHCVVHNEYIRPNDIGTQIVWFFRTCDGRAHTFALLRSNRAGPFGRRAWKLGESLLPHLKRALEFEAQRSEPAAPTAGCCMLVVAANGNITLANAGGTALLGQPGLISRTGMLAPPTSGEKAFGAVLAGMRSSAQVAWGDLKGEVQRLSPTAGERIGAANDSGSLLVFLFPESEHGGLSPRERECLLWVARGGRSAEIATRLDITERTVNQYINSAVQKLGARNRTEAAVTAALRGIISP
jgi:DNA-binding CsgD family transcriptional regulator